MFQMKLDLINFVHGNLENLASQFCACVLRCVAAAKILLGTSMKEVSYNQSCQRAKRSLRNERAREGAT